MQAGDFDGSDVRALKSIVLVGGVRRDHVSWNLNRELAGDLPDQVVGGSGIRQAQGTIVWSDGSEVSDRAVNPWSGSSGWLPKPGQIVTIRVSDGVTEWTQFQGVIDETRGEVGGPAESTIIDYSDWLNVPFNHSTVLRLHPPRNEGTSFMGVGMSPAYVVDRLFRRAGFYATPRLEPNSLLSAPLQTSVWPERGFLVSAGAPSGTTHGLNVRASWGWCLRDFSATYEPQIPQSRTEPLQITAMAAPDHSGSFTLDANYGAMKVRLWINTGRAAVAFLDGVEVCRLSLAAANIVTLLVKNGVWTLRSDAGGSVSGNRALPSGEGLTTVSLVGDNAARIAGVQVSKPTALSEFQSLSHSTSAYQETGQLLGIQDALPSIVNKAVKDVLEEISQATLSPFWFDERGRLVMYGSDVLRGRTPVQEVTTLDDITRLSWSDSRLSVRSSVQVKYKYPALNRSRYSNVLLWQGTGETMDSGQEKELFAKEPSDEDWVEPDNFKVSNAGGIVAFNAGRGTWVSTYLEDSSGGFIPSDGYATWSPIRAVDDETRLFSVKVGTLPTGYQLVLGTPEGAANYSPRMRGINMPVLRGRGRVQWADLTLTSTITGPSGFPALEHEIGCWGVQTANALVPERIADYIASQVTTPTPTITGMNVTYDPRRQLGDVITIKSPTLLGVELRALIVGVRNSAGSSFQQSLDVRVISAKSSYTSYNQLAEAWAGGNYNSLNAAWAALNYNALAANPLEVTP